MPPTTQPRATWVVQPRNNTSIAEQKQLRNANALPQRQNGSGLPWLHLVKSCSRADADVSTCPRQRGLRDRDATLRAHARMLAVGRPFLITRTRCVPGGTGVKMAVFKAGSVPDADGSFLLLLLFQVWSGLVGWVVELRQDGVSSRPQDGLLQYPQM